MYINRDMGASLSSDPVRYQIRPHDFPTNVYKDEEEDIRYVSQSSLSTPGSFGTWCLRSRSPHGASKQVKRLQKLVQNLTEAFQDNGMWILGLPFGDSKSSRA